MLREKKGALFLVLIGLFIPVVSAYVYQQQSQSMIQYILNMVSYYEPNSDVSTFWSVTGSSAHYGAIDDGIRNTSTPDLTDYIYTSQEKTDEVGFTAISESGISSIVLWVYSETGSNALTTVDLKNDGIVQATLTVNPSSSQAWRSTTWSTPSSIGSITVELSHDKQGGGASMSSTVYSIYLEVNLVP